MKIKVLNESGLSLIDALISLSLIAFFVAFLPQVFSQTQKAYHSATKRSEMDRTKQLMMIAAKNITRVKRNIQHSITSAPVSQSYDEFLNCFGQKGPNQPRRLPGTRCDQKFGNRWIALLEAPPVGGGSQENLFWINWGSQGVCQNESECLMKTGAYFNVPCTPARCFSIQLMLQVNPTERMLAMASLPDRGGFALQDFENQKMQMALPGTMFGSSTSFNNQNCDTYMGQLDPNYYMLYCNNDMRTTDCATSVHSLGANACTALDFSVEPRGARGTVQPGVIDVAAGNSANVNVRLCAETFGSYQGTPVPHPTDPHNNPPTMQPNPFFNPGAGDQLHINCPQPIGNIPPLNNAGCTNVSVVRAQFSAPSTLICQFFVTTAAGNQKGSTGQAEVRVVNSEAAGPGGGNSPTTTVPNPTINPTNPGGVGSGEL